ncbi:MAG TPA: zinc ribbon domain-containing protein [Longilinea sp.]|nr:zinc ribbon domain-containing protein [Longilinea sp.]
MKSFWKWLLIFLGVLIAAFLVALPFFTRFGRLWWRPMTMMGGFHRTIGVGFAGGNWLMMLAIFLVWFVVGVLVVAGIVALVRSSRRAPVQASQAVAVPVSAPEAVSGSANTCKRCGKPLQPDWVCCPYCGKKVSQK